MYIFEKYKQALEFVQIYEYIRRSVVVAIDVWENEIGKPLTFEKEWDIQKKYADLLINKNGDLLLFVFINFNFINFLL